MKPQQGWFSIVQFCPDANRLESANIGVLLFCPALDFLDVRIASDNRRIIKFFGSKDFDLSLVNSFKKGLAERLRKEHENISDHEQLLDFADRRANQIRISQPRSIRVTEPRNQIEELFGTLVGEGVQRVADDGSEASVRKRLAQSLNLPAVKSKIYKSVKVKIPIDGRELNVPFAFRNGRFNLIQPARFQSDNALQTAYRYAVEGESIYETRHERYGKLQLMVVGSFRDKNDENKAIVQRVLEKNKVKLYALEDMDQLVHEIQETGKDRTNHLSV